MKILSFNPGHYGAFAYLDNGQLVVSIEAEKHSGYRYSPVSVEDVFSVLGEMNEVPDVLCRGGWRPDDTHLSEHLNLTGYHGVKNSDIKVSKISLLGKKVETGSRTV